MFPGAFKRGSSYHFSQVEAQKGSWKKLIATEKEGRIHQAALFPLARKVKPIASSPLLTTCWVKNT